MRSILWFSGRRNPLLAGNAGENQQERSVQGIGSERMSFSSSTAKENTQKSHQAVMQPALDSREPESSAVAFERVLNTEEAAALLQIHPKTLQKMAREGTVPGFRIGDLWRFRASALDEWLRSGVCSKRHSCRQHERKVFVVHARTISVWKSRNQRTEEGKGGMGVSILRT
jgi:excisionase family DNA binding protein